MAHAATHSAFDDCFPALVAGLAREFGADAGEALARRFVEAEDADFHWDARCDQRLLGTWWGSEDAEDLLLDRMAVQGRLDGRFYVAVLLTDGDLAVHGLLGLRHFANEIEAQTAFAQAR